MKKGAEFGLSWTGVEWFKSQSNAVSSMGLPSCSVEAHWTPPPLPNLRPRGRKSPNHKSSIGETSTPLPFLSFSSFLSPESPIRTCCNLKYLSIDKDCCCGEGFSINQLVCNSQCLIRVWKLVSSPLMSDNSRSRVTVTLGRSGRVHFVEILHLLLFFPHSPQLGFYLFCIV